MSNHHFAMFLAASPPEDVSISDAVISDKRCHRSSTSLAIYCLMHARRRPRSIKNKNKNKINDRTKNNNSTYQIFAITNHDARFHALIHCDGECRLQKALCFFHHLHLIIFQLLEAHREGVEALQHEL
jgi:hypothetical protein